MEATRVRQSARSFKLTGQLGDVMKESAEIAYSYVVGNAQRFGASSEFFDKAAVHLHVPAGATPKDGPSAGITMATALLSLAKRRRIRDNVAMTGELTLTGRVLPVGGIKEKVLAAKRAGISELVLPKANQGDVKELAGDVIDGVKFHFVAKYPEVASIVFEHKT